MVRRLRSLFRWVGSTSATQAEAVAKAAAAAGAIGFCVFAVFAAVTYPGAFSLLHLAQHGITVKGVATATHPEDHNGVDYTFKLGGRTYTGSGYNHVGAGDGGSLALFVNPSDPSESCACDPLADAQDQFVSPPLFGFILGAIAFVVLWLGTSQLVRRVGG